MLRARGTDRLIGEFILAICILFAAARVASADCSEKRPSALKLAAATWATGATADLVTTYRFASGYPELREQNPLVSWLRPHPAVMVAMLAGIDAGTYAALGRWSGCSPRLGAVAFAALSASRFYVTVRNVHHMRTVDTDRRLGVSLVLQVR
jgi:hypothetical protein